MLLASDEHWHGVCVGVSEREGNGCERVRTFVQYGLCLYPPNPFFPNYSREDREEVGGEGEGCYTLTDQIYSRAFRALVKTLRSIRSRLLSCIIYVAPSGVF